jgi:hypothetical protein
MAPVHSLDRRAHSCRSYLAPIALVVVLVARTAGAGAAPPMALPAVKAAYLYNFAKFAEWPADVLSINAPVAACVVGDDAVGDELEKATMGHPIGSHSIVVVARSRPDSLPLCHMLYVSGLSDKVVARLLDSIKGLSVFTVGDGEKFAERGGVAQLIQENGRMHFAINVNAAQRAQITLSSKLLSLAKIVKDEPHVQH